MKKLLFILFAFISVSTYAQRPTGLPTVFGNKWYKFNQFVEIDSAILIGPKDTSWKPIMPSLVLWQHQSVDTAVWLYNGLKWLKITPDSSVYSTLTALKDSVNLRVRYSDTSSMLSGYAKYGQTVKYSDTSFMLSPYLRSYLGVKYSDTASMLSNRLKISDTASMLAPYARSSTVSGFVKYTDTSLMLSPYLRSYQGVKYTDTSSMLSPYARLNYVNSQLSGKVNYTDTSSMLSNYLRKTDTSSMLSGYARSGQVVKYSDTSLMLSPYLRSYQGVKYTDTASMLNNYRTQINSLVADTNTLITRFGYKVNYSDTANMLSGYLRTGNQQSIAGKVNYTDTASMLSPYLRSYQGVKYSDTASMLNNYRTQINSLVVDSAYQATQISARVKYTDTSSMLSGYLRTGNATTGTVTSVNTNYGLSGGPITTSGTLSVDTSKISTKANVTASILGKVNYSDTSSMLSGYAKSGQVVKYSDTTSMLSGYQRTGNAKNGTVTSISMTVPSAFNVSPSTITTSGTFAITGAGSTNQYVRGDGSLAVYNPGAGGGGASVNYYLNGSVSQGTFGGTTYYQMSKTPNTGTATNFTNTADGYIASFITDAGDPNLLNIPAGNWNIEIYFSSSSAGGSPSFYVELYKYNGSAFTLISSNSATPEYLTNGTATDMYSTSLGVPSTTLSLTDRLAIRVYVAVSGRNITMYTQDTHLGEVITTFSTGITALNGLTTQVQNFATGTSGSDFNISSVTNTHTFNLPTASASTRGALSSTDWTTFNNKVNVSDTASMLSPYLRSYLGVKYTDTTSMLSGYLRTGNAKNGTVTSIATTNGILGGTITSSGTLQADTTLLSTKANVTAGLIGKVNYSDTSSMLSNYRRKTTLITNSDLTNSTISGVSLGSNLFNHSTGYGLSGSSYNGSSAQTWTADTSAMSTKANVTASLLPKVNYTDTASMLNNYRTQINALVTDTNTLATRFGYKVNYSDTSSMLSGYLRTGNAKNGTVTSVGTGYGLTGGTITSSGTISSDTTALSTKANVTAGLLGKVNYSDTSSMLSNYRRKTTLITNSDLTNSTISGVSLGSNLNSLTNGYGVTSLSYNGSSAASVTVDTTNITSKTYLSNLYQTKITNPVTGTGTTNYVAKFTGSTTLGNSSIYDNGTNVGINNGSPAYRLDVNGTGNFTGQLTVNTSSAYPAVFNSTNSFGSQIQLTNSGSMNLNIGSAYGIYGGSYALGDAGISAVGSLYIGVNNSSNPTVTILKSNSSVGINTTPSYALDVSGQIRSTITQTYSSGSAFSVNPNATYTFSGSLPSSGVSFGALNTGFSSVYNGNTTVAQNTPFGSTLTANYTSFSSTGTATFTNSTNGIKASGGVTIGTFDLGSINGTVTASAGLQINGIFQAGTATITRTNHYGVLINSANEFGNAGNVTNKWGIYQIGTSDYNILQGNTKIGYTNNTISYMLDVNGTGNFAGALTGTSATFSSNITLAATSVISYTGQDVSIRQSSNTWGLYNAGGTTAILTANTGTGNLSVNGGATLGGALSGTSATFSGQIAANAGGALSQFTFPNPNGIVINSGTYGSSSTAQLSLLGGWGNNNTTAGFYISSNNTAGVGAPAPQLQIGTMQSNAGSTAFTNNSAALTIASSGAATFSSSVTAGGVITGQVNGNTFGTASASGRAVVVQAGSANQAIQFKNSLGGDGTLYATGDATSMNYQFNTYSTANAFVINNNGNVGIGTTSPTQALTVNGNAAVGGQQAFWLRDDDGFSSNSGRRAWAITANYVAYGMLSIYGASAANSNPLSGTAFVNITSGGNVLINETSISGGNGTFEVNKISGSTETAVFNSSISGQGASIYLRNAASQSYASLYSNTALALQASGGNVGIGTTSPGSLLAVGGNPPINGAISAVGSSGGYSLALSDNVNSSLYVKNENGGAVIGTDGGGTIRFATNGSTGSSERMRITSGGNVLIGKTTDNGSMLQVNGSAYINGNVGINVTSPTAGKLQINGDAGVYTTFLQGNSTTSQSYGLIISAGTNSSDYAFYVRNAAQSTVFFYIRGDNTAVFTSLGTGTVYSNGGALTNTNPSDIRLKNSVENLNYGLDAILKLQPKQFYYNSDTLKNNLTYGLIAQDVQKVIPEIVRPLDKDYLGIKSENLVPILIKAIQELQKEIDELKNKK